MEKVNYSPQIKINESRPQTSFSMGKWTENALSLSLVLAGISETSNFTQGKVKREDLCQQPSTNSALRVVNKEYLSGHRSNLAQ